MPASSVAGQPLPPSGDAATSRPDECAAAVPPTAHPAPNLNHATLAALPAAHLRGPGAQWREPEIGIVHLGLGNFHRAHQALYTEDAMLAAGGDWGICGVSLTGNVEKRDAFRAQDGLYSLVQRGPDGVEVQVIRSLREVLTCPDDAARLMTRLCAPACRIVSLTVTEKGYCRDADGEVDTHHPDIAADLAHFPTVRTVPGWLVGALARRRAAGMAPFTVMSCDNLSHNGAALKRVVVGFAAALDKALADWIAREVAFPSTMVDRIVPASTADDLTEAAHALGCRDALAVPCEPFRQWVIEDRFSAGRPAWEHVGATLVDDVAPYELAKLRMLNAAHSTLAYWSLLLDIETIDRAVATAPLQRYVHALLTDEIMPVLGANAGIATSDIDLATYRDALLTRFANPALKHRSAQIAMDGSLKLPLRWVPSLMEARALGIAAPRLTSSIAAWIVFLSGRSVSDRRFPIQDPMAPALRDAIGADDASDGDDAARVSALLSIPAIFPPELAADVAFHRSLTDAVKAIRADPAAALQAAVSPT
ncbi:mannitol dehydrogenase family protein [Robbsia sp. KACC 23696]|uniref:mannitol dehydrogenase family protein n=1 Tax=Robbsia sp. KACC 23696 TaxID=3149231 RepID=UPI00325AB20E